MNRYAGFGEYRLIILWTLRVKGSNSPQEWGFRSLILQSETLCARMTQNPETLNPKRSHTLGGKLGFRRLACFHGRVPQTPDLTPHSIFSSLCLKLHHSSKHQRRHQLCDSVQGQDDKQMRSVYLEAGLE